MFDFITSTQTTDRRSRNILDRAISITQFPLVAKSYQTKAQAGHKVEELYFNPCPDLSAPSYSPCQQVVSAQDRYPQSHQHSPKALASDYRHWKTVDPSESAIF